jgi:hypothetical protein
MVLLFIYTCDADVFIVCIIWLDCHDLTRKTKHIRVYEEKKGANGYPIFD